MSISTSEKDPLALLSAMERRAKLGALGLPREPEGEGAWRGVGFRLGSTCLVAAMGDVEEVLNYPHVARVPGTKAWMRGLSNLRGTLLPVIDLQSFLAGTGSAVGRNSRVLVIREVEFVVGLQVDEVYGLKQFEAPRQESDHEGVPDWAVPYSPGVFQHKERWIQLDVKALILAPEFVQAAV